MTSEKEEKPNKLQEKGEAPKRDWTLLVVGIVLFAGLVVLTFMPKVPKIVKVDESEGWKDES